MPSRIRDVDPAGQDCHGDSVGGQRRAVSRAVDAVRATGDDRDVAFGQPGRQIGRHMLAVRRRGAGSDHGGRTLRHLVEACGTQRPQHHRRPDREAWLWLQTAPPNAANASTGHSSPSGVINRPPRRASSSRSSAAQSISRLALGVPRQVVIDHAAPDPVGGLHRANGLHQGGEFRARRFGHPGQVSPGPR